MSLIVVNLFAGPGAGKSTTAADVFARLKRNQLKVELVAEFAKDLVWEGATRNLADQLYLLGNQAHRLWRCAKSGVEIAVTDSPLLMSHSLMYGKANSIDFDIVVEEEFDRYDNLNFLLHRVKPYEELGRMEKIDRAMALDEDAHTLLNLLEYSYTIVKGNAEGAELIETRVLQYVNGH